MKRIASITFFASCCFMVLTLFYLLFEDTRKNYEDYIVGVLAFIFSASAIYYVVVTKFGSAKRSALDNIELENEIIKKQIEKRKLLARLEALEKNG